MKRGKPRCDEMNDVGTEMLSSWASRYTSRELKYLICLAEADAFTSSTAVIIVFIHYELVASRGEDVFSMLKKLTEFILF